MTTDLNRASRRALAKRFGVDPADVGRIVNRASAGPRAGSVNSDDVDRITIPDTPEGLEDMLRDGKKMAALFQQKDGFKDFVQRYAKTVVDRDRTITDQVQTEVQRTLAQWLKDQREQDGAVPLDLRNANPAGLVTGASMRDKIYNARAMGAAIDKEFKNSAEFFQLIWHNANRDSSAQAKLARVRNAFSSTVPSEGGFLIPETLRAELLRVSLETAIVRPRARVIPMETLRVPFPAVDASSNVDSVYGGVVGYWTEEGGALTPSEAKFARVVLEAKKLTAYTEVPNELISDSISSFQAFLDEIFPEALGFYEDKAFISGSGAGEPLGVLNAPAAVSVAKESGQPADSIVWENIVKAFARMLPGSLGRAVWICSIDSFPELATMALSVGTGGSAIWLNNGAEGPPMTILGRPVIFSEKVPKLGDAGDLNFVDFGFYLIGDRQVMSAMSSPHYKFGNDMTAYRIINRVDGRPWLQSAITPANNGPTLSPYVKLAERA
ncbi:phage major capsid protein [Micromonospora haikouensis]|uniref:phage major capsid protein n=1 Tax=Micromonospora haikouensis TaxID=686309 RepID=UPI003D726D5C